MQKNEAFLSRKRRVLFFSSTSLVEKHDDGDDESANLSRKENFKSDILFFLRIHHRSRTFSFPSNFVSFSFSLLSFTYAFPFIFFFFSFYLPIR